MKINNPTPAEHMKAKHIFLPLLLTSLLFSNHAGAATTAFTGSASGTDDNWNVPANWDGGVPTGTIDALINDGSSAQSNFGGGSGAYYTGSLTLGTGSSLKVIDNDDMGVLGTGTITLSSSSSLLFRGTGGQDLTSRTFELTGNGATIRIGESTASSGVFQFGNINGAFDLITGGNNNSRARFTTTNSFTSVTTLGSFGFGAQNFVLEAYASGALGSGTLTINDTNSLLVNLAGGLSSSNILELVGATSNKVGGKLFLNADNTVGSLFIDGVQQAAGTYTNSETWLGGIGTLTVVPEPSTALLGALGLLALLRRRR